MKANKKPKHCALCRRPIKPKDISASLHGYSRFTGNYYCPITREDSCIAERQRLIRAGVIDLDVENANVRAAMRRNA